MDKLSADHSTSAPLSTPEARTLRDVVHSSKHTGRNYGSLAKSQLQPTFYIPHHVELDDTLQRLALKYTVNIQEIKRVNQLWSDAELRLLESVYIPVNGTQLTNLQSQQPSLEVLQNLPPLSHRRQSSINDDSTSSLRSSDSTASIPTTSNSSSFQDYFSKIDQQIRQTKKSLQSLDVNQHESSAPPRSNYSANSSPSSSERHKGAHHLSDNSVFVNIMAQNSRDKYVSAALQRIQREKDNFDEL